MTRQLDVVAGGFAFLSSPRWRDGRLWVVDGPAGRVLTVSTRGQVDDAFEVPHGPSGLGWLPDGRMLVVSAQDQRVLRREPSGELVTHADLATVGMTGDPNDLLVGPNGRSFVGDFWPDRMNGSGAAAPSRLYCIQPDGELRQAADDLWLPNGMVLFPDYTLVIAESGAGRLLAFNKGTDGSLSRRRIWALLDSTGTPVVPAGICADIDGNIWVADALGNRVLHVRPGGEILEEVETGGLSVHACMLGGDDGRTLYVCAAPSSAERERRSGDSMLLAVRVDVPHGALP